MALDFCDLKKSLKHPFASLQLQEIQIPKRYISKHLYTLAPEVLLFFSAFLNPKMLNSFWIVSKGPTTSTTFSCKLQKSSPKLTNDRSTASLRMLRAPVKRRMAPLDIGWIRMLVTVGLVSTGLTPRNSLQRLCNTVYCRMSIKIMNLKFGEASKGWLIAYWRCVFWKVPNFQRRPYRPSHFRLYHLSASLVGSCCTLKISLVGYGKRRHIPAKGIIHRSFY